MVPGLLMSAQAQEGAPQEAPYVEENIEFNDALSTEEDIFKNPEASPAANPPAFETDPIVATPDADILPATKPAPSPRVMKKNAKGGVEYIQHPQAAQGLIRIEKDGSYIYRVKEKEADKKPESISVRFGSISPPKISSVDGTTTFEVMYSNSQVPILLMDYEWQPFSGFGKLGVQGGFGFLTAQGNGRFANGTEAEEKYTFYAIPLSLGAIYRLEFADKQWMAPYISGGGTYFGVIEMRDDSKSPNMVGAPGIYGAGGIMFNVGAIDREMSFTLRDEYGIRNLWVTAEYRQIQTFNEELDFSSGVLNVGVSVDY